MFNLIQRTFVVIVTVAVASGAMAQTAPSNQSKSNTREKKEEKVGEGKRITSTKAKEGSPKKEPQEKEEPAPAPKRKEEPAPAPEKKEEPAPAPEEEEEIAVSPKRTKVIAAKKEPGKKAPPEKREESGRAKKGSEGTQEGEDSIVVTATKVKTKLKDVPVKTEVVGKKKITQKGAANLLDALDNEPGVVIDNACSICGSSSIKLSGLPGRYTLYLMDGLPLYSSLGATYGLAGIPAAMIERVEIVKGASSVLYGTDAIGGVVNIITKKPNRQRSILDLRIGHHQEYNLSLMSMSKKRVSSARGPTWGSRCLATMSTETPWTEMATASQRNPGRSALLWGPTSTCTL